MNAQLVSRVDGRVVSFAIPEGGAFLGREPEFAVCLPLEGVSRVHAKITFDGTDYLVEDLKSTNGTFVNGDAVQRERLRHLDVISLGRAAQLVFVLGGAEAAAATRTGITRATLVPEEAGTVPYEIAPGEITIGRAPTCNVVVDNTAVSSLHLRIQHTGDALILVDLASSNGTLVNGARILTATLNDGDVISLGGVATFTVKVERGSVTGAASGPPPVAAAAVEAPQNWKTRLEWSPAELMQIAAAKEEAAAFAAAAAASKSAAPPKPTGKAAAASKPPAAKPAAPPPAKAAPPAPKPAPPPSPPAAQTAPSAPQEARPAAPVAAAAPNPPAPEAPPKPSPPPKSEAPPKPERIVAGVSGEMATPTGPVTLPRIPRAEPSDATTPSRSWPIGRARFEGSGYSFAITSPGEYAIGRAADAHLQLSSPMVSRKHARIVLTGDRAALECHDLGGANSTMINGRKGEHFLLVDGDEIQLGDVKLLVTLERQPGG